MPMPFTIVHMSRFALFAPRYWPTWLLVVPLVVLAHLPWRIQFACGRLIGHIAQHVAHRRRAITATNLAHCFPDLDQAERERLLHEHFEALGIGLTETALCWWAPDWRLHRRVEIYGIEHLQRATEAGHGVLMLTAHFTTLELGGRLLAMAHPVMPVYRPHENPVIEHLMQTRRRARTVGVIRRGDLRSMLRHLRRNTTIWYAPDQAYLGPRGVAAPFFGIPAPTNTATARIAAATGAPVLPFFVKRLNNGHYRLDILPALDGFPSGDDLADATRVNAVLEQGIRKAPAQYLWSHDRFKQFRRP